MPSLLGVGDEKWANSLAACGILSEVGKYVCSCLLKLLLLHLNYALLSASILICCHFSFM